MAQYQHLFKNTKGPGDARPTAIQIVEDLGLVGKLEGKTAVVTGVSSGIGIETLRALYITGAHVFGTARDLPKAKKVIEDIESKNKGGKITLIELDLNSLASVKAGGEEILKQSGGKINLVINNAGVMATPYGKTKDGWETQFGVCHLAHFYLFQILKDALLNTATPDFPSRVVSVASIGHRGSGINWDDINYEKGYNEWLAYGQAKTANIYFSNELERRYGSKNLHSTSLHPGGIATGLTQHIPGEVLESFGQNEAIMNYMKSPEQGAATSIYAALSPEWANKGGKYLSNFVVQEPVPEDADYTYIESDGYKKHAYDEASEKRLWKESLKMVSLSDDQ